MTDKMREFVDEVKQLCKDFSDQRDRPYMGDVHAALDGLYEQWQAAQAVPVVGEPVAYGVPNSRPTESLPFMQVMLQIPANAQYPELLVPLIVKPTNYITAAELEGLRECEAVLAYVRRVLPMEKWADDSRRMIDAAMQERKS